MKLIKVLSIALCSLSLVVGAFAGEAKTCCEKAKAAGKDCTHKCCVEAKKDSKSCEKCSAKKAEKKAEEAK